MTKVQRVIKDCQQVESEWLKSIGAPVTELPQQVAEAVTARVMRDWSIWKRPELVSFRETFYKLDKKIRHLAKTAHVAAS